MGIYGHTWDKYRIDIPRTEIELLDEDNVYLSKNMRIDMYPNLTREVAGMPTNAYFEVYNNPNKGKATKILRLLTGFPWIVRHEGENKKLPAWDDIRSKELKEIQNALSMKTDTGLTIYQTILNYYNIDIRWPMPDYTNITEIPKPKTYKIQLVRQKFEEILKVYPDIKATADEAKDIINRYRR